VRRLKLDATPDSQLHVEEAEFTTSRYEECGKRAASIDDASMQAPTAPMILIRDAMKLACQWAGGAKADAYETEKALLRRASSVQKTSWNFSGTIHYLAASPNFRPARTSWIALFDGLEKADSANIAAALHNLEDVIRN